MVADNVSTLLYKYLQQKADILPTQTFFEMTVNCFVLEDSRHWLLHEKMFNK